MAQYINPEWEAQLWEEYCAMEQELELERGHSHYRPVQMGSTAIQGNGSISVALPTPITRDTTDIVTRRRQLAYERYLAEADQDYSHDWDWDDSDEEFLSIWDLAPEMNLEWEDWETEREPEDPW